MKTYRNDFWGFSLSLPNGWREPYWIVRLFNSRKQLEQPQFIGPFRSGMKFAIHPIRLVPDVNEQQKNLEHLSMNYGHQAINFFVVHVDGKEHAEMVSVAPGLGEVKTYSLIFDRTEFLITAWGRFNEADFIVKSFKLSRQR